ncbi:MAG: cob(I)yrinic acid a,c-diamide adenosyltransferase [Oribacterium sp.]|nr:cob(I)yrinic acid a,c-diamide adenosyltransferase [Oribacterium sp.]
MVHIYHGNGKGKTSAAVGAAVRAAGHNIPVVFCQFLKDGMSGEISILEKIPGILVLFPEHFYGWTSNMTSEELAATRKDCDEMFGKAIRTMTMILQNQPKALKAFEERRKKSGIITREEHRPDIVALFVFDEILDAVNKELLDQDMLARFLLQLPEYVEVILTGRNPDITILSMADYVTNMVKDRHPYDDGIKARVGVEK